MIHPGRLRIVSSRSPVPASRLRAFIRLVVFSGCLLSANLAAAQSGQAAATFAGQEQLILGQATVAETVKNGIPYNSAAAFSISLGRIYCFTDFVEVGAKTVIYHIWYHRDDKRASVKLALRPPRWATFSSVSLRDSDKGPWQVEVTTENGAVLQTLRFSVID